MFAMTNGGYITHPATVAGIVAAVVMLAVVTWACAIGGDE